MKTCTMCTAVHLKQPTDEERCTRTNPTITGSIPTFWEPTPLCLCSSTVVFVFRLWLLSVCSAPHLTGHPQAIALLDWICSSLVFIAIRPWESLSCPSSSWCYMITNTGTFTIGKFLLIDSLTPKSIFLIMFMILSSALLPATHLYWLIRSESPSFSFSST